MADFVVGVGMRPGTDAATIRAAVAAALGATADVGTLRCLATVDSRAAEPALVAVAADLDVSIVSFPAGELADVPGVARSARTAAAVGTPSVAEAAAVLAGRGGRLVVPKRIVGGVTVAVAELGSAGEPDLGTRVRFRP